LTLNTYYVDGKFVPADKAVIPVDDLAILRGIGVFDLLRTYNGKPYFLNAHVTRLHSSAEKVGLKVPWSHRKICQLVLETLARNTVDEANIRIIVTGGSSPDFMTPKGRPRLLVLVTPLPMLPQWWYSRGVKVITVKSQRNIPSAKSIDYLPATMGLRKAKAQKAIEVIYLDAAGNALEGATSNLFAFIDGTLVTPGRGMLAGITRQVVLEIAQDHYPVETRDLPFDELLKAQEIFITGTNKGLVPVVEIDEALIGKGRPGQQTRRLTALLEAHTTGKDAS
jgi:branched-chain amino acid aminotransferase